LINWIRKNLVNSLLVLALIVGIGLLLYPSISNYWNSFHQTRAIMDYTEAVANMSTEDYKEILRDARDYNRRIGMTGIKWVLTEDDKKLYNSMLKIEGTEVMGYISMPKFHIKCPIYHGTDEAILQIAIGHLEGTSLPVGGKSTHCVISGHRGLPSARLFTDLDRVKEGDTWTITVLNETLTYECDQIRIVEPEDLSELRIIPGEDLCTLVTCTPYGVNTHRLLIRGHRIPNADGTADLTADAVQIEPIYVAPVMAVPALILLLLLFLIAAARAKKSDHRLITEPYISSHGISADKVDKVEEKHLPGYTDGDE